MSCPNCGATINDPASFCPLCGKALHDQRETVLYEFGPFGVNVCFRRPSFFTVTQRNNTKIVLTNRRVYGVSTFTGKSRFDVPYEAVVNIEVFNYLLYRVLWLQYRKSDKLAEVSVMCAAAHQHHIARAYDSIQRS
ncbi:MAG: zinc ribbon domain-containing protein [Candidatus Bathyarchaeia archaeon]